MLKILIHACPARMWYVNDYLIPSLKDQGIEDIRLFVDDQNLGCVYACMKAFSTCEGSGHTWHLQDDVVIAENFRELAESYEWFNGIVCGICTRYDDGKKEVFNTPAVERNQMWLSFPCIRIPDILAKSCAFSFEHAAGYEKWKESNRGDDMVFRTFLKKSCPDAPYINAKPNLVDHVDYLVGDTTSEVKKLNPKQSRAKYFDPTIAEKLAIKLGRS